VRKAVRYCSLRDAMAAYRPLLPVAGQASAGEFRLNSDIGLLGPRVNPRLANNTRLNVTR
jgi:hypothetical protein